MIRVTPEAAAEIARRLEGKPAKVGFRIYVQGFGWGGPSLGLALEEPSESDVTIVDQGMRIYLEERVARWFDGAELGFQSDPWGGEFTFNHPNLGGC